MKLRIQGESIRFRLMKSEVERLDGEGALEETIHLPLPLTYALKSWDRPIMMAVYVDNRIEVSIPSAWVADWAQGDQVSIEGRQDVDGRSLRILIEKDFKCLDAHRPEDVDAFPNPKEGAGCAS